MKRCLSWFAGFLLLTFISTGVFATTTEKIPTEPDSTKKTDVLKPVDQIANLAWFKKLKINGYFQLRYNGAFQTSDELRIDQADKNIEGDPGFSFRRARVKISGFVTDKVYVYVQSDFAGSKVVLKDAYSDLYLNNDKTYRLRFGLSKVPYGFENMQSSSNRLALDRADPTNSAFNGERDMGVTFFWTPTIVKERFNRIKREGLKHSGDYGMFALAVINGQNTSDPDENKYKHIVSRLTYPFEFSNGQLVEVGIQGMIGKYTPFDSKIAEDVKVGENGEEQSWAGDYAFNDRRVGASFVMYPQPFGLQAEYNIGEGPEYDPESNTIKEKPLHGGYIQAMYRAETSHGVFFPFVKWQRYDGGKKFEQDARAYKVNDFDIGMEWQINKAIELVGMYSFMDRKYADSVDGSDEFAGSMLRMQLQFRF
ncbi:porin [Fulvitalea axinellae]